MDIQNNICDTIEMYLENSLKSISRDITIQGKVTGYIQPKTLKTVLQCTGYYKIKYQDSDLYCYTAYKNITYSIGQQVYILVPQGNFNKNKFIIGKNYDVSQAYASVAQEEEQIDADMVDAYVKSIWGS